MFDKLKKLQVALAPATHRRIRLLGVDLADAIDRKRALSHGSALAAVATWFAYLPREEQVRIVREGLALEARVLAGEDVGAVVGPSVDAPGRPLTGFVENGVEQDEPGRNPRPRKRTPRH